MQYLWFCLWLLFFPNAAYIVTYLFHLKERSPVALWFDLVLLGSAAINGIVLGLTSLYRIEQWLHRIIYREYISLALFLLLFAGGFGIYLGRYLRWNSWDILASPFGLGKDIATHIIHPFRHAQSWMLSLVFAIWMLIMYNLLKRLSRRRVCGTE